MNVISFLRNTFFVAFALVTASLTGYAQTNPELLHFQSKVTGQAIAFNWSVSEQSAVQSFGLERAGADMQFKTVGAVTVQPDQNAGATYRLADQNLLPGVAFYRLKIVNRAGDVAYGKALSHQMNAAVEVGR